MDDSSGTILVVGYNACDVLVPFEGVPEVDAKHEVQPIQICGGGPGATAAVALARLGADVRLVTPLTDDMAGQMQRSELSAAGVDISWCPTVRGHESPKAVILVDPTTAERTIFWSRGTVPLLDPDAVDPEAWDGVRMLYSDGHEIPTAIKFARVARQHGLKVVLDAGNVREGTRELVRLCTDVITSAVFAPLFTGHTDPLAALLEIRNLGPERVGMTRGAAGVLALVEQELVQVPAFVIPAVDTTGAGDVFHAAYAHALHSGLGFLECLEFGCAAAAIKCCGNGGRGRLPGVDEVQELIRTGRRRNLDVEGRDSTVS